MEPPGRFADHILQALLYIHVNVFKGYRKRELALFDLGLHLLEAPGNFLGVGF